LPARWVCTHAAAATALVDPANLAGGDLELLMPAVPDHRLEVQYPLAITQPAPSRS
jgi:hypothetical protein